MKIWYFAHMVTILSFLMAVGSIIYFKDYLLSVQFLSTIMIFMTAERIRKRELLSERLQNE